MALITCKDCEKPFSTDAKHCPNCGAKKPGAKGYLLKWTLAPVGVVLFLTVLGSIAPEVKYPDREMAPLMCEEFIKDTLHDPASADFDPASHFEMKELDDGIFNVIVTLHAKNGFNAMRKMSVACRVQHPSGDNWKLIGLINLN